MVSSLSSEPQLLAALAGGDMKAFDILYAQWHRRLYGFAMYLSKNEHEAEELVQAVFVALWEARQTIDPDKPFGAFLFSIARNRFTDLLRRRINESRYINKMLMDEEPVHNMEQQIEEADFRQALDKMMSRLPDRRRQIFEMSRQQNLSYKQIADLLNISENTVDTQIRNVLNYLRKEIPKYLITTYLLFSF